MRDTAQSGDGARARRRRPGLLRRVAACAALALVASGCGPWPPVVEHRSDALWLDSSEPSLRVRFLPPEDYDCLARFRHLRRLGFGSGWAVGESRLTDAGLAELADLSFPHLEELDLSDCNLVTDEGLEQLARFPRLRLLLLGGCEQVTDVSMAVIADLPDLEYLDLRDLPLLTDEGLAALASARSLRQVVLCGASEITTGGVRRLAHAPRIELIDVTGCPRVSGASSGRILGGGGGPFVRGPGGVRLAPLLDRDVNRDTR